MDGVVGVLVEPVRPDLPDPVDGDQPRKDVSLAEALKDRNSIFTRATQRARMSLHGYKQK